MPDCYAETGEGLLLIANGVDPMLRWDGYATSAETAGLTRPSTPVTAAGSGVGTLTGQYFAFVSFIRRDGFESSLSNPSASFVLNNNAQIDYSSIPVSNDPRVVARRIYRTTAGQALAAYLDVEINDNTTTTATSTLEDSILQERLAWPLFDDSNNTTILKNEPPPDDKPFITFFLDRCYAVGYVDYAEGSVEVTAGSVQVVGHGTDWKETFAGRFLYVSGGDATYEIESVDEDEQTLTLTTAYTGTTNLFAGYSIRPDVGRCALLQWTEPSEPEAWNPLNALAIPEDDDRPTGVMPMYGFLYVLKRRSIYRFTSQSDPARDGFLWLSSRRGCINNRCWVVIGQAAYMLDERGVHVFTGSQESQEISGQIQDIFRDNSAMPINWAASKYFHASHSPGETMIRWYVSFRGDYLPRHALCFCYATNRWSIDSTHRPIGCSTTGPIGRTANTFGTSGEIAYVGADNSDFFTLAAGSPDAIAAQRSQISQVVTASIETVTIATALPDGMVGGSLVHRGDYGLQVRRIVAVSDNVITVSPPWQYRPLVDDPIYVGGFAYQFMTQGMRFVMAEATVERSVEVSFRRNKGSILDVDYRYDYQDDEEVSPISISGTENYGVDIKRERKSRQMDMGKREGYGSIRLDGLREGTTDGRRRIAVKLSGVGGNGRESITQLLLKGVS